MSDLLAVLAAALALAGSILSLYISTRLALSKERRQLRWSKEIDRLFQLEELAGSLVETLGGWRVTPESLNGVAEDLSRLESAAGRFARYRDVRQSIRDLHNVLARMFVAIRDSSDDAESVRAELDPAFRRLLNASDEALRYATKA